MTNGDRIRTMTDDELTDFIIKGCWGELIKKLEKSEVMEWLKGEDSIPAMEDLGNKPERFLNELRRDI